MAYEFKFPDVGEGVTEGEIVRWKVKEGDIVKEDQVLAEVETDKAVVEIPSPKAGTILKVHAKEGERIKVGATLVTIGEKGEESEEKSSREAPKKNEEETPTKQAKKLSGTDAFGKLRGMVPQKGEEKAPEKKAAKTGASPSQALATPSVRHFARERGIDLSQVKGTGPAGRITKEDVDAFRKPQKPEVPKPSFTPTPQLDYGKYGKIEEIPFKGIRKRIAENMVLSHHANVPVSHHDVADVTKLAQIRENKKDMAEQKGFKLTFLPFIIKAVLAALKKHPVLNASLDIEQEKIIVKKYYDFGIAVQTDKGLLVPVIRNTDDKSILKMAKEIQELAERTREGKAALDELKGSTFTITNVGSIGGWFFTPVINPPEVAILGIGRMEDQPVAVDGKVAIRKILPLSLTFDHRVVDGAIAAQFMNEIITHLEDPELLLMDVF